MGSFSESLTNSQKSNFLNYLAQYPRGQKSNRREQFIEIARTNSAVVDDLIKEARLLLEGGKKSEAGRLIDIIEKLLRNNEKYQNVVGEILSSDD